MPLETMLRIHFLQNWYTPSDPMAEESLYDSEAMRRFVDIELEDDRIPDETTILQFRHLPERHDLAEALFDEVNAHLPDKGIGLPVGTLVDATIIPAPSSTKKGNTWHFGMETHVDVDSITGVVHGLEATTAKSHESRVRHELLHGNETSVRADKVYGNSEREVAFT